MSATNVKCFDDDWMSYRLLCCIERHSKWTPGRYEVTICADGWVGERVAVVDDFGNLVQVPR